MKKNEIEMQRIFHDVLQIEFQRLKSDAEVLVGNEFKNIKGKKWAKKPDLVIFHNHEIFHPTKKKNILKSPIGIEYKDAKEFKEITKGVVEQIKEKYSDEKYKTNSGKEFCLNSLAFATTSSIKTGKIYSKRPELSEGIEFATKRFCWRSNVATITKFKEQIAFSFVNYYFGLTGEKLGSEDY